MTVTMNVLGADPLEIEAALAAGKTFPARWYSDAAIYELELEHIFTRTWHVAGPLERLRKPGDHIVCQVAHIPIVLTRDLHGELHGFVNVCRHRAYPVVEAANGARKTLQCRYHGWTYNLDGTLRAAPRCEREAGFDKSEFSLVPVAVDTWGEFAFVNPDAEAPPFRETHPEFEPLVTSRHLDFSGYRYVDQWSYEISANWKVWVENATECYHCPTIHKGSFSDAFEVDVDIYEYVNTGQLMAQFTPYNRSARTYTVNGKAGGHGFRFIYFWPTSFFAQDDYVAFSGSVIPTGPESCRFVAEVYVHPDCDEQFVEDWMEMYNLTLMEDAAAVAIQQPGLRSRMVPHGRLMPASESSIAYFHRLVWEALSEAVGAGV